MDPWSSTFAPEFPEFGTEAFICHPSGDEANLLSHSAACACPSCIAKLFAPDKALDPNSPRAREFVPRVWSLGDVSKLNRHSKLKDNA